MNKLNIAKLNFRAKQMNKLTKNKYQAFNDEKAFCI